MANHATCGENMIPDIEMYKYFNWHAVNTNKMGALSDAERYFEDNR